jgi:hypothetical protein
MRRVLLAAATALAALGSGSLAFVAAPHVASAADDPLNPAIKPDAVLSPGQTVTLKHDTPLVGSEFFYSPAQCRGEAPIDPTGPDALSAPLTCKAYRIAVNIDPNPKAYNVVLFQADFDQVQLPSLVAVAAGLNPPPLNGLDVFVWDTEDHYLGRNAPGTLDPVTGPGDPSDLDPGGSGFNVPERGGFQPKQKFYDITVNASAGINQNFTLRVTMSNELFKQPAELLDDPSALGDNTSSEETPDTPVFFGDVPTAGDASDFTLPPADVVADPDIAGVGLGVNEEFSPQQGLALGGNTRNISTNAAPPSSVALWLGMVLFPVALTGGVVAVAQRRRKSLLG